MCSRTGCTAEPEWRPVLVMRAAPGTIPARCVVGVGLCGFCKTKTKLADLLTDASFDYIASALEDAGKPRPDRELARLDFCGINSKESRALTEKRES